MELTEPTQLHEITPEKNGRSFSSRWALRQLGIGRRHLKCLTPRTLLLWGHNASEQHRLMYVRIRPRDTPNTFSYEAVDTISTDEHSWTYGSFTLEGQKFVLLTKDGEYDESAAFALMVRTIRRCEENPLVEGDRTFIAAWCDEPSENVTDITPLMALSMTYLEMMRGKQQALPPASN